MLNFFTMMVYTHSVNFIILIFPCIQNLSIIQLQAMLSLALNFRFLLAFDNSGLGVQFYNKPILCKMNIALQTVLLLR